MTDRELMERVLEGLKLASSFCNTYDEIEMLQERLARCDRCGKKLGGGGDVHTCSPQEPVPEVVTDDRREPVARSLSPEDLHEALKPYAENSIQFYADQATQVMRLSKDGVWVNPDITPDAAAQAVLNALDVNIKVLVQKAVEAEREACAKVCDELQSIPATEPRHCAEDIRARGNA